MSGNSIDLIKALKIEILTYLNHTGKETLHTILDIMSDRSTPKDMHNALDICMDSYDNILDHLKIKDFGTSQICLVL